MHRSWLGWRWAGALGTALTLHYALLVLIASPHPPPTTHSPRADSRHLIVEMILPGTRAVEGSASSAAPPAPSAELDDSPQPVTRDKRNASRSVRFFTLEEVEHPAVPTLDWQLPLERVVAATLRRMVVRIWILDDGTVANVEILSSSPATLSQQQKSEIEEGLRRTELRPAIRNDRPVASVRTLEMAFDL